MTKAKLVNNYLTDPCYSSHRILGENCVAFFRKKKTVKMNKLYASGMAVLELSKNLMTTFYYRLMQPRLGQENLDVLMTDTDSYILHVKGHTKHETLRKLEPIMDFSNYDVEHPLHDSSRKLVPGYFKNENPKSDLLEVISLRSKCYVTRTKRGDLSARCKGINRKVVKNFDVNDYKGCLQQMKKCYSTMRRINYKNHKLSTVQIRKVSLSSYDQKRFLYNCGLHSCPFGSVHATQYACPKCGNTVDELMDV